MVRTVGVIVDADGGIDNPSPQYAGVQGEHNLCEVSFDVSAWVDGGEDFVYRGEFVDGNGTGFVTDLLEPIGGVGAWSVSFLLPGAWTAAGGKATARLVASVMDDNVETERAYVVDVPVWFKAKQEASPQSQRDQFEGLSALLTDLHDAESDASAAALFATGQGNYAKDKGDAADLAAIYANTQGGYANTQGDYAKNQGDYAKNKADALQAAADNGDFDGADGADGGYYQPSVNAAGDLSWTASDPTMPYVGGTNIKGPQGDPGNTGPQGPQGEGLVDVTSVTANYNAVLQSWHYFVHLDYDSTNAPTQILFAAMFSHGLGENDYIEGLDANNVQAFVTSPGDLIAPVGEHLMIYDATNSVTIVKGDKGQDAVVDATLTQQGEAADAKATGDAFIESRANWSYIRPINKLDESQIVLGKYMSANGVESSNASYCHTGKIPVNPGDIVTVKSRASTDGYYVASTYASRICAFNAAGNAVSASGTDSATYTYTVPSGIYAIVISQYSATIANGKGMVLVNSDPQTYSPYFTPYWAAKDVFMPESYTALKSSSVGMPPAQAHLASMGSGDEITCGSTMARNRKTITFRALISTMGQFTVWNGTDTPNYFDSKAVIDGTNVTVYSAATNGYNVAFTDAHGLTFADYVSVRISLDEDGSSHITIDTNGGSYTHDNVGFNGRDTVRATSEGAAFTDVYLSWTADFKQPVWIFGDSYTQLAGNNYWTKQLVNNGFKNFLLCGYPGAKSKGIYPEWKNCLEYGRPRYALWTLGMNDADSTIVNFEWERYYKMFLEDCEAYGITPILATIPNVPARKHTLKNAVVTASGKRYVDFAQAVGAEAEGSGWFTGMLATDNVHPTTEGAVCLEKQALAQMPELMQ